MRRIPALLLVAGVTVGATPGSPTHAPTAPTLVTGGSAEHQVTGHGAPAARLPGFAAALSEAAVIAGPDGWRPIPYDHAWGALAHATRNTRQNSRWDYAGSLIAKNYGSDALGVLEVMEEDDPDLALVPSWQLARGAALTLLGRAPEALAALTGDTLASNPEACAWRMRSMAQADLADQALAQVNCALPAINARTGAARSPFILAAGRAAVGCGRPAQALTWLRLLADRDPAANLYRGKAYLALGQLQAARLRLDRVALSGSPEQQMDAKLSAIETEVANGNLAHAKALKALSQIAFTWRGGDIEKRTLRLSGQLSADGHDLRGSLAAGAALFRYFSLGKDTGPLVAGLQSQLTTALSPESGLPIDQAAGLYWDFRDLAPSGGEGDLLVSRLASRLEGAGLYRRAAELLDYQLTQRAKDITKGPLSVRVASLYILGGQPGRALKALRATDANPYPQDMLWDRHRVEAAALHQLGQTNEALAVLQEVPDGDRIRAEIYWKKQDWTSLAAIGEPLLPRPGVLTDVGQAMVLRHAIALAMLGRDDALSRLHARYAQSFSGLPIAATFEVLTRPAGAIDPAAISKAMAALPSASPAGSIGDLLDADPSLGS